MVSSGRNQIPGKASRALRAAGMGGLAAKRSGSISKHEAVKALKHLEKTGALGKYADSKEIFHTYAKQQATAEATAQKAVKQKHARAAVAMDILEDLRNEELGIDPMADYYAKGSVLGRSSLRDEVQQKAEKRNQAQTTELKKKEAHDDPTGMGKKPKLIDMDIG